MLGLLSPLRGSLVIFCNCPHGLRRGLHSAAASGGSVPSVLTAYCLLPTAICLLPTGYCLLAFGSISSDFPRINLKEDRRRAPEALRPRRRASRGRRPRAPEEMLFRNGKTRALVALVALLLLTSALNTPAAAQKKKALPRGTPVLWRDRDPARLDLASGPGGASMRPVTRRLRFLKEEKGGYSKKYRVRDARGREWVVKVGKEAQSEAAAT